MSSGKFVRADGLTVEVITLDRGHGPRQFLLARTASGHTHHGWAKGGGYYTDPTDLARRGGVDLARRGGVDLATLTFQENR